VAVRGKGRAGCVMPKGGRAGCCAPSVHFTRHRNFQFPPPLPQISEISTLLPIFKFAPSLPASSLTRSNHRTLCCSILGGQEGRGRLLQFPLGSACKVVPPHICIATLVCGGVPCYLSNSTPLHQLFFFPPCFSLNHLIGIVLVVCLSVCATRQQQKTKERKKGAVVERNPHHTAHTHTHTMHQEGELVAVNGVPVAELERRMRPLVDKEADPTSWRQRAATGFLGDDGESLVGCISADTASVVGDLCTTHVSLAQALRAVVDAANAERARRALSPWCPVVVGAPLAAPCAGCDTLLVESMRFNAPQLSPFAPDVASALASSSSSTCGGGGGGDDEHRPKMLRHIAGHKLTFSTGATVSNDDVPEGLRGVWAWDTEHVVTNKQLGGLAVTVTEGSIGMIAELGFYEGGAACGNPYRIEPLLLSAVLGGAVHPRAADVAVATGAARAAALLREADAVVAAAMASLSKSPQSLQADTTRAAGKHSVEGVVVVQWVSTFRGEQSARAAAIVEHWSTVARCLRARSHHQNQSRHLI